MNRADAIRLALILLGVAVTAYLTAVHLAPAVVPLACSSRGIVDCAAVLTSPESRWLGEPVSGYGLLWFLVYLVAALGARRYPVLGRWTGAWAALGVLTVFYLVFVEFVVLHEVCLWCSLLHAVILALFGWELWRWGQDTAA